MVGFETPRSRVASPTVEAPPPRRSTMSRRIGWARALNGSLAILLTIYSSRTSTRQEVRHAGAHSGNPGGVASGARSAAGGGEGAHTAGRRAHEEAAGAPVGGGREGLPLRDGRREQVA